MTEKPLSDEEIVKEIFDRHYAENPANYFTNGNPVHKKELLELINGKELFRLWSFKCVEKMLNEAISETRKQTEEEIKKQFEKTVQSRIEELKEERKETYKIKDWATEEKLAYLIIELEDLQKKLKEAIK